MRLLRSIALMLAVAALCCCSGASDAPRKGTPVLRMSVDSLGGSLVVLYLELLNADGAAVLVRQTSQDAPTAEEVSAQGKFLPAGRQVVSGLLPRTGYIAYACACRGTELGAVEQVEFTTLVSEDAMYAWERRRVRVPAFADLVLLYGSWRRGKDGSVLDWTQGRIAPLVSWTDGEGVEKWLFDAFLALEGCTPDGSRSFMMGTHDYGTDRAARAATKADAEVFIDWWFRPGNGFHALDAAIAEAAARLGTPPTPRYAVMMMPDIPVHERYNDSSTSTAYWGSIDGVKLDFGRTADRLRAYQWYVDEVRRRFDAAGFRCLELGGFYPMTEELPTTRPGLTGYGENGMDGWEQDAKRWDDIFPALSQYIHQYRQSVAWIPYRVAAGYRYASDLGLDQVYMQPNYLWNADTPRYNMSAYFSTIAQYGLGMELELDDLVLASGDASGKYRERWRAYIDGLKTAGVYGSKPLALYQDTDSFNNFRLSGDAADRELLDELCSLIANDPKKASNY